MTQKDPLADLPWPGATVTPSETCSQAIRGTCTKGLCKERGVSPLMRSLLTLGLCVLVLGVYAFHAFTVNRSSAILRTALFGALGWFGAQAALVFATLGRPPGKGGSRNLRLGIILGTAALFTVYVVLSSTERFGLAKFAEPRFAGHAVVCGIVAIFFGLLITAGALIAWRRTDPYHPGLSGATVGLVAGLATGSGMTMACGSHEALHACFAHGLVVFALALVGFGLGRRLLAP
jgi:hypothetical protein